MHPLDLTIIVLYLLGLAYVGCWLLRKGSLEEFLVNGRKTKFFLLIFTIISSNVGIGTFLGFSSTAFETGISYGLSGFLGVFIGWIVVAKFAPRIKKFGDEHKAHTIGDFFGIRYSKHNRLIVSLIILISCFLLEALQFVGIAGLLQVLVGVNFKIIMFISSFVVIMYATVAGLRSNFYTDIIHFWVIVIVLFFVLLPVGLFNAGGIKIISSLPARYFNPFAFGGPGFFIGALIFCIPVLLLSMEVWQRIYASSTEKEARRVFIWAAIVNVLFIIPPIVLGLIATKVVPSSRPDFALFELMKVMLPPGLFGLGIAGVIAAGLGTLKV